MKFDVHIKNVLSYQFEFADHHLPITVGRSSKVEAVILYESVSRHHLSFFLKNNTLLVKDLNSVNGTYLAENKLTPQSEIEIKVGTQLKLGKDVVITVTSASGENKTQTLLISSKLLNVGDELEPRVEFPDEPDNLIMEKSLDRIENPLMEKSISKLLAGQNFKPNLTSSSHSIKPSQNDYREELGKVKKQQRTRLLLLLLIGAVVFYFYYQQKFLSLSDISLPRSSNLNN